MPNNSQILHNYLNPVFIETGTFGGDGIQAALHAGFPVVHSIEINPKYVTNARKRFEKNGNVHIHLGDSAEVLPRILSAIKQPITFFLDAHGRYEDKSGCPIVEELMAIAAHPLVSRHTIIIDDIRLFAVDGWGVPLKLVSDALKTVRKEQEITRIDSPRFKGDLLVSTPLLRKAVDYKLRVNVGAGDTVVEVGPFQGNTEEEIAEQVKTTAREGVFQGKIFYPPAAINKVIIAPLDGE